MRVYLIYQGAFDDVCKLCLMVLWIMKHGVMFNG